jgi:hypothetical protein
MAHSLKTDEDKVFLPSLLKKMTPQDDEENAVILSQLIQQDNLFTRLFSVYMLLYLNYYSYQLLDLCFFNIRIFSIHYASIYNFSRIHCAPIY